MAKAKEGENEGGSEVGVVGEGTEAWAEGELLLGENPRVQRAASSRAMDDG